LAVHLHQNIALLWQGGDDGGRGADVLSHQPTIALSKAHETGLSSLSPACGDRQFFGRWHRLSHGMDISADGSEKRVEGGKFYMDEDAAQTFVEQRRLRGFLIVAVLFVLFLVIWLVAQH
jgi:hypothetical protein